MVRLLLLAVIGCAAPPPPRATLPPASLVTGVPGGYFDDAGLFHAKDLPIALHLPRAADLGAGIEDGKQIIGGRLDQKSDEGFAVIGWKTDAAPTEPGIVGYLERFETEAQLAAARIGPVAWPNATIARGTEWIDPDNGLTITLRYGWRPPWNIVLMTFASPATAFGKELAQAATTVAFVE